MAFAVSSNSFKDGDYLRNDFILSADFGFGCAGGNKSPHLKWSYLLSKQHRTGRLKLSDQVEHIANTPGMNSTALTAALRTSHESMPNIIIKGTDLGDVIAYILSLRKNR